MASFNLGEQVGRLDYDFTTGAGGWDPANGPGKGVIPEPSRGAMRAFRLAMIDALGLEPSASESEVSERFGTLSVEEGEQAEEAMIDALAAVCSGHPSASELRALGLFGLQAFAGFMFAQLASGNPTRPANATNG